MSGAIHQSRSLSNSTANTSGVTVNLAGALRYVKEHWQSAFPDRDPGELRLWADAICIDQSSVLERNSQVKLMKSIYASAELVLAWLGSADEVMEEAITKLRTVANETEFWKKEDVVDLRWLQGYPDFCRSGDEDVPFSQFDKASAWDYLRHFFDAKYWSRV